MCVFARNFHYFVTAKHQLVAKALKKERRLGCDVGSFHERETIPEDMDGRVQLPSFYHAQVLLLVAHSC